MFQLSGFYCRFPGSTFLPFSFWGLLIKAEGATGEFVVWLYCYIWVTSSLGGDFLIWVGT